MFNQNFLARTSSHYLTVLVLCSGSFFSEPSVVLANQNVQTNINSSTQDKVATSTATASSPVLPAALNLIKQHEGFRSYAYIDSNGLPVIGYGQSIVPGLFHSKKGQNML